MAGVWRKYLHVLDKFPLATMAWSTGAILAGGDGICQLAIERRPLSSYDGVRTGRFFIMGFCVFGPMMRGWYKFLDRLYSGSKYAGIKMLVTDQVFMAPWFLTVFLTGMGLLRGDSVDTIKAKLKTDFVPILINNYKVWPLVQIINFHFLPLQHRVLFVNCVALGWNSYLAWASEKV